MSTHHRTRIKFCGMTRSEDVERAIALGVDAIGLIFAARSPRRLTLAQAKQLRRMLPPLMSSVALTMDADQASVREIVDVVRPSLLQFHGDEQAPDCAVFGVPYLKVVPMGDDASLDDWFAAHPAAAGFVLDGHGRGQAGGSGRTFDWSRVPHAPQRPLLLAGGLTADNVYEAIVAARPFAVDVSSGIEAAPGEKCPARMARFVDEVRRADADLREAGR